MGAQRLIVGIFLCLLGTTALAATRSSRSQFCNLQQLTTSQPLQRLDFEGGSFESYWGTSDEQYQCLGAAPSRMTIQPNSMLLPSYQPFPRLLFIEQGEGIFGVQLPGCVETFDTGVQQLQQHQQQRPRRMGGEQGEESADAHQRVHRFQQGDIVAIPGGTVFWTYNDRNQDVVAIILDDTNNHANQLDLQTGPSFLAGGISSQHLQQQQQQPRGGMRSFPNKDNVYSGFDTELLAEALRTDPQIVRAVQEPGNRGMIVKVQQPMDMVTPEEEQEDRHQQQGRRGGSANGVEEKICSSKLVFNLENQREADVFSRQAGKLNLVNEHKLPILSYLDLSAEKGHLQPNALFSPHWTVNGHTFVYVLRGDAHVQVVSNNGEAVLDEQVSRGQFFAVPQFFATTARAGQNGFEWVAFKTNKSPMKSPLAGYTSVFRAMPLEVITHSYDVSPSQAQELKTNRGTESLLLSPQSQRA